MGSGFDDWVYWHFFIITVNYNSSHIELHLTLIACFIRHNTTTFKISFTSTVYIEFIDFNGVLLLDDVCLTNLHEESLTALWLLTDLFFKVKVTLRLTISQSWRRSSSWAHGQIFITVWQLRSCFCGTPSLTRGRVAFFTTQPPFYNCQKLIEIPPPRFPLLFFMNALPRKPCLNSQATISVSECLQLSVFLSLETVFRNQLVSSNQSLHGNVFTRSFPRNDPHVTVW
jgi:hypothetical protein